MRETSFGYMHTEDIGGLLQGKFEVMQFYRKGKPHTHDVVEVAICVRGSGHVMIGEGGNPSLSTGHSVRPGDYILIPAGLPHWMEPNREGLAMLIAYRCQ